MNLAELESLEKRGFFQKPTLRAPGYKEKVPDKSVFAKTARGKKVLVTGFFAEGAIGNIGLVQYHDGKQFRYIPSCKLSFVEIISPAEGRTAQKRP